MHAEQSALEAEEEVWRYCMQRVLVYYSIWNESNSEVRSVHLVNKNGIDEVSFSSLSVLERLREHQRRHVRHTLLQLLFGRLHYAHRRHSLSIIVIAHAVKEVIFVPVFHTVQKIRAFGTYHSFRRSLLHDTEISSSDGRLLNRRRRSTHMKKKG